METLRNLCPVCDLENPDCQECPVISAARPGRLESVDQSTTMADRVQHCIDRREPPVAQDDGEDLGDLDEIVDGGFEGLAQAVRRLADAARRMESSGLNRRALVLLLADASKVNKREISLVLDALSSLEERFLSDE